MPPGLPYRFYIEQVALILQVAHDQITTDEVNFAVSQCIKFGAAAKRAELGVNKSFELTGHIQQLNNAYATFFAQRKRVTQEKESRRRKAAIAAAEAAANQSGSIQQRAGVPITSTSAKQHMDRIPKKSLMPARKRSLRVSAATNGGPTAKKVRIASSQLGGANPTGCLRQVGLDAQGANIGARDAFRNSSAPAPFGDLMWDPTRSICSPPIRKMRR